MLADVALSDGHQIHSEESPFVYDPLISTTECAHIGHAKLLIQKGVKLRLCIPGIKGDWEFAVFVICKKRFDQILAKQQLAFINLLHGRVFLIALPDPHKITAPFARGCPFERIFSRSFMPQAFKPTSNASTSEGSHNWKLMG